MTSAANPRKHTRGSRIGSAVALMGDVMDLESCEEIVNRAVAAFERVDILINVVGVIGARGTAVEVDLEEWARGWRLMLLV